MKKLVLKFNAHPGVTLEKIVGFSNSLGLLIESIEDLKKSKAITIKTVTISGVSADVEKFRKILVRVPAVTVGGK